MDFYGIGIDPTEGLATLVRYRDGQDYPWPVAKAPAAMLPEYSVLRQPAKLAIDADGVIAYRGGYSVESEETWQQVFRDLSQA